MNRLGKAVMAGIGVGVLMCTAACSGSGGDGGSADGASAKAAVSAAKISVEPANGATDVKPGSGLKVSVAEGKLTKVTVTDQTGKQVPGALLPDNSGWAPSAGLAVASRYTVHVEAADAKGTATSTDSSFATLTPAKEAGPHDNIVDGSTYGVGMIVRLEFKEDVKDKAAVEKAVTFETSDGAPVKGHWFNNRWVDFRPETFWKSGSKVTVHYRLKSIEVAPGVYGGIDSDQTFTVGRDKRSTVDAATHQMTVEKDGRVVETIPISTGASSPKSWNAYNGTMAVMERKESEVMDSSTVPGLEGSDYKHPVPHSLRLTTSGTYVHGNNWSDASVFGRENVSHGCVGLQDTVGDKGSPDSPAGKFFADSIVGDVVTIKNSVGEPVNPSNGYSGWNVPWSKW
ncbi:lipoprotein-anchoring transpeptidase ErfK/SrfK [Kitasatospora gansuensis]|uniref:Lipoprotein-anchoring transpeptidase ErfK/SrfK n=1 Tax=Kitasatospora gansuensis TaxID=258050 RepID=A0A7W7S8U3_9ACTN|nr:Ig-like domain-containing protein [Kitasatospora gansuensis]MBB4946026.1 lipoprotein-anchoring transpeptidase ErfK/SrfK [Kitasatospora gansuensis]